MENFEEMTVIELRKYAKEHAVKLSAGIDKQGIVERLQQYAREENEPAVQTNLLPEAAEKPENSEQTATAPVRHASIITDDTDETDDDDLSVFSASSVYRATVQSGTVKASAAQSNPSSLTTISSKAPAFTMEGARAWHNPRSFSPAPPPQSYARTQWSTRPVPQATPYSARNTGDAAAPTRENNFSAMQRLSGTQSENTRSQQRMDLSPDRIAYTLGGDPAMPLLRAQAEFALSQGAGMPLDKEQPAPTPESLLSDNNVVCSGFLDIIPDKCGYLRLNPLQPTEQDILVTYAQIKRFSLRKGDFITGTIPQDTLSSRFPVLLTVDLVNGTPAGECESRPAFDTLSPIYPKRRIPLSVSFDPAMRLIDMLCPIGFGQRAMICVPKDYDKNTLFSRLTSAITESSPEADLSLLLLGMTPEDTEEMRASVQGKVFSAPFGTASESTVRMCESIIENAMRRAEQKKDTVIILDSLNALARSYHSVSAAASRILYDDLSASAVSGTKRFFAAGRNTKEGGTITVICIAELESRLCEELRPAANMVLYTDKELQDKKLYPAVQLSACITKHGEIMQTKQENTCAESLRNMIKRNNKEDALQALLFLLEKTKNNEDLATRADSLISLLGK